MTTFIIVILVAVSAFMAGNLVGRKNQEKVQLVVDLYKAVEKKFKKESEDKVDK